MKKFLLRMGILPLVFLAACALLSGPRPIPTAASQALPALDGNWQTRLSQTGGIMGISRSIVVASDGQVTAEDARSGRRIMDALTPTALAQLKALVAGASYPTVIPETGCADCFYFRLEFTGVKHPLDIQLDQLNLAGSGLDPLVAFLHDEMVRLLGE
jgi:hypothetical protein